MECVVSRSVGGVCYSMCVCVLWLFGGRKRLMGKSVLYTKRQMEEGSSERWPAVMALRIVHG